MANVKLLDNVIAGSSTAYINAGAHIVLDLNGKKVMSPSCAETIIVNSGTLTIHGNGIMDASAANASITRGLIENNGVLTIINGTFEGSGLRECNLITNKNTLIINGGTFESAGNCIFNDSGATATIDGGTFSGNLESLVLNSGTITITGGAFASTSCYTCNKSTYTGGSYGNYTLANSGSSAQMTITPAEGSQVSVIGVHGALANVWGTLVVNGGTFKTVNCASSHGATFYPLYNAGERGIVTATINGGTFESFNRSAVHVGNSRDGGVQAQAKIVINGGTFSSRSVDAELIAVDSSTDSTPSAEVKGGYYDRTIDPGIIADGYGMVFNSDKYDVVSVSTEDYVAMVSGVYYTDLASAVSAASAGETVALLKNIDIESTLEISKNLIIDLNGNDIKAHGVRAIHVKTGALELTGKGTVSADGSVHEDQSVIRVGITGDAASLILGKDVTISTDKCYGVTAFGENESISVTINGTVSVGTNREAFSGNGLSKTAIGVTIGSDATLSSTGRNAIYFPGTGTLSVSGQINGGIEAKAGTITIKSGAQVTAASGNLKHEENNNDPSTYGYALAIVNNNSYKLPAKATIETGATMTGHVAIIDDDKITGEKGTISFPSGYFVASITTDSDEKATIGYYSTLSDAVTAAQSEQTIKILANTNCVSKQNKTLTFDTSSGVELNHPQAKVGDDVAATCTHAGSTAASSCACGQETKSSEVIPKKDHTQQTVSGRDATCTRDGYESYVRCSVCNTVLSGGETIPATGHSWDSGTVTKEATETSEGVKTFKCTSCGATKTESVPKLTCTHTWDSGTVTQEATCGAAGSKTVKCTKCGETKTESIAATGNHSWDSGTVVKEPTTTESGTTEYKCTVCGQTKTATIEPKKTEVEEKDGVKTTTDTTKTVEKSDDGSETTTETTTVSKEENGKVVEKVETTKSTTEKDGTTIVSESTVTEKDGQTEKVETTKSTTQTEDTTTVAESTVTEKNGQLVEKVETTKSTTQTEDSTIVSETKVTEKAGEATEKVETITSTTQKEGATIVAETKVTEKGQEKTETIAVSIGSDDGTVKTDVSVSNGATSGIETVISGDVTEDTIAHAIKQADMATEAISEKVSDVSKNISVPSDNVTLSPTSLGALADSGASLTITGDAGSIGIDAKVTGTMMSRNEDVTISISEKKTGLTDEQKQKAGTSKVIELSAKSATEDIHELGGTAKVRIDMIGMDFKSPAVYWLKDDGSSERVDAEFGEGYAAIELNHFSLYYIAETAKESENSTVMYVAIAVVIIAILAIAGVVMYKRKAA